MYFLLRSLISKSSKNSFVHLSLFYPWSRQVLLKLWCAFKSPENLDKMQILIQWVWVGIQYSPFLIRPMLPIYGLHFEYKGYTQLHHHRSPRLALWPHSPEPIPLLFVFIIYELQPKPTSKPGAAVP